MKKTYQGKEDFDKYWSKVKLLLRVKYDKEGFATGFHSGGKSHRGMYVFKKHTKILS